MTVEIVTATVDDVDGVADDWVDLAREMREYDAQVLPEENRATVRETLLRAAVADRLLLAVEAADTGEAGGETADREHLGFVQCAVETGSYDLDVTRGVVVNLYVVPEARGQGIGSDLLAAAEERLREAGVDTVSLEVMTANDGARRFYERHGYAPRRVQLSKSVDGGENDSN